MPVTPPFRTRSFIAVLPLLALAAAAPADDFQWTGAAGNSNWNNANNWINLDLGSIVSGFPTLTDTATIPANATAGGGQTGGLTINPATTFTLSLDDLTLANTLTNNGTFTFQNSGFSNAEVLSLEGVVTFTGGGALELNNGDARINAASPGSSLINSGHTLRATAFNSGSINLDIDNTGGLIEVLDGSRLNINGTVAGGTINNGPNGYLRGGLLADITNIGTLVVTADDRRVAGTLNNPGTITYENSGFSNAEVLLLEGPVILTGGGSVQMSNFEAHIGAGLPDSTLHNVNNTIAGQGVISVEVENDSLIRAQGGRLQLAATDNTQGIIEITTGARLSITGPLTGGTLSAQPGSTLDGNGLIDVDLLGTVTIHRDDLVVTGSLTNPGLITYENSGFSNAEQLGLDGTVTLDGGGVIELNSGDARIDQINPGGGDLINIDNTLRATAGNSGQINVNVQNAGTIELLPGTTLTLGGEVTGGLIDIAPGAILNGGLLRDITNVDTLTVSISDRPVAGTINNLSTITFETSGFANNEALLLNDQVTLTGGGEVIMTSNDALIAQQTGTGGLINANNTLRGHGTISVPVVNNHLIRAEGGRLNLAETQNSAGDVEIAAGARLHLTGPLTGGSLHAEAGSSIQGNGLHDVDLSGTATITIDDLIVKGTLTNTGTITYENSGFSNGEILFLDGPVTLDGGGEIVMNSGDARIDHVGGTTGGLNNVDNTIRVIGPGNSGTISVDVTNAGTFEIESNSTLNLGGTVEGGTFDIDGGGRVLGGLLKDITLNGVMTVTINDRRVAGTLHNTGEITFENSGFSNPEILLLDGPVEILGGGDLDMNNFEARIGEVRGSGGVLTNTHNTIRGQGFLDIPVINNDSIQAVGGKLTAQQDLTSLGGGSVFIAAGSEFEFNGSLMQQRSLRLQDPTAVFDFNGDRLEVGTIDGGYLHDQGTLAIRRFGSGRGGSGPQISGDYNQLNTTVNLEFLMNGNEYRDIVVIGDVTLAGTLSLVGLDFTAIGGEVYPLMTIDGTLTGAFLGLDEGAFVDNIGGADLFITYLSGDGNDIALFAIPEPTAAVLLGLSALVVRRRAT
ncbi:MAG: hypothetical protein RLN76_12860 [Phycisphaeraceae bacterium]